MPHSIILPQSGPFPAKFDTRRVTNTSVKLVGYWVWVYPILALGGYISGTSKIPDFPEKIGYWVPGTPRVPFPDRISPCRRRSPSFCIYPQNHNKAKPTHNNKADGVADSRDPYIVHQGVTWLWQGELHRYPLLGGWR